ncbi:hypothetical protein ACFPRL_27885 [Pseudoclavibacter helvolus]
MRIQRLAERQRLGARARARLTLHPSCDPLLRWLSMLRTHAPA